MITLGSESDTPVTDALDKIHNRWVNMIFVGMAIICIIGFILAFQNDHIVAGMLWAISLGIVNLASQKSATFNKEPGQ